MKQHVLPKSKEETVRKIVRDERVSLPKSHGDKRIAYCPQIKLSSEFLISSYRITYAVIVFIGNERRHFFDGSLSQGNQYGLLARFLIGPW